MKYLAILKDSFREAIDTRIFLISVLFSCLLALTIASISFQPLPAHEAFQEITSRFSLVYADRGRSLKAETYFAAYQLLDLQPLNEAARPPAGDYRFKLRMNERVFQEAVTFWSRPEDAPSESETAAVTDRDAVEFIKSQYALHGNIGVRHVKQRGSTANHTVLFDVETKGKESARGWPHELSLFCGALTFPVPLSPEVAVFWIEDSLVNGVGAWAGILAGIVATAFFIPSLLQQGTIGLVLVKPVSRAALLFYKYLGGLTFVLVNAAIAVTGVWLAVGLRTGIWTLGFFLSTLVITLFFAVLYAVSTFFGILTRSPTVAILMSLATWLVLWMVGSGYASLAESPLSSPLPPTQKLSDSPLPSQFRLPESFHGTVEVAHFLLPRAKDLDVLTTQLLSQELLTKAQIRHYGLDSAPPATWVESILSSFVFILTLLSLGSWRFATHDY